MEIEKYKMNNLLTLDQNAVIFTKKQFRKARLPKLRTADLGPNAKQHDNATIRPASRGRQKKLFSLCSGYFFSPQWKVEMDCFTVLRLFKMRKFKYVRFLYRRPGPVHETHAFPPSRRVIAASI